jgi:hypothetical protein
VCSLARVDLVGRELGNVPNIAEGSSHFLYDVHLFESGLQRLGGRLHRVYRGMTGRFACDPSALSKSPGGFPGFTQLFPLLPYRLERLTMLVADHARFLGQSSELFRLVPGPLPQIFLHRPVVFGRSEIVWHVVSLLLTSC